LLTTQEVRIMRLVATGLSNFEVGEELGIREKSVKYHMTNLMSKLKVRNRVEVSVIAQQEWGFPGVPNQKEGR
jgi:DNA-binding NarL/FixJ family response regulator